MHSFIPRRLPYRLLAQPAMLALVLLAAAAPALAQCQWTALPGAPLAGRIDDMTFLDADTGWCVTSSGQVWHTADGGATWTNQFQTSSYLRSVAFLDYQTGWAGALSGADRLYRTLDGGQSWEAVTGLPPGPPLRICGMAVVDTNSVIACGGYDGFPGYLRTDDGGATWTARDFAGEATNLIDVFFLDPLNGFLAGGADGAFPFEARAAVFRTQDGGATWTRAFTGTDAGEWCWKIFFLTDLVGFISVENFMSAKMLQTVDGGATWQEVPIAGNTDIQGIGFVDEDRGWVGGWGHTSETTDGGRTWNTAAWGSVLNRFVRISPTLAYASGETVYKWVCPPSAVPEAGTRPPSPLALGCRPNPFNARTTIVFEMPEPGPARVRIYDGLGKHIRELLDAELPSGPQDVAWDGRDDSGRAVASGVYLYRVDAAGTAESRSMVLVK